MALPWIEKMRRGDAPQFTGASAAYPWDAKAATRYKGVSRFGDPITLYEKRGNMLLLPRALCPVASDDRRVAGVPVTLDSKVTLRPNQQPIVNAALPLLLDGESFQIQAPTGIGKTVMMLHMLAKMGRKALVIVPQLDILNQWRKQAKKCLGLTDADIGLIQGPKYNVAGKPLVLGVLKSLSDPKRYPASMRAEFGVVVWDEVHLMPAPTFSASAWAFSALVRVGLSATTKRKDGKDIICRAHIGEVRVRSEAKMMPATVAIYRSSWRCPRKKCNHKVGDEYVPPNLCSACDGSGWCEVPHEGNRHGHILNRLVIHQQRNEMLAWICAQAHAKGRNVVLMSDRKAHLEQLRAMVVALHKVPEEETGYYVSGMSEKKLDAASVKPLIFATYGMMGTGTDIPWLDCCILATPRSDVNQIVGRALREHPEKPNPIIVDILDGDSSLYRSFAKGRRTLYQQRGYPMKAYRTPAG